MADELAMWPAISLEGRTEGENIIALFYEVRQARREFQQHIEADRKAFDEIQAHLRDIKTTVTQVNFVSKAAARVLSSLGFLIATGGGLTILAKHLGW